MSVFAGDQRTFAAGEARSWSMMAFLSPVEMSSVLRFRWRGLGGCGIMSVLSCFHPQMRAVCPLRSQEVHGPGWADGMT